MEKTVLSIVLQIAMGHVNILMDHVKIVKKVQKVIALKVIINIGM